ncbi:MAG: FHA domain-containing protein [Gemmataceae bacterium]
MAQVVRLTVHTGPHKGARFCFRGPTSCLAGRSPDCFVRFFGSARDQMISRLHCQLQVDPPLVRLQDLGSRNGTYVNGRPVSASDATRDTSALFEDEALIAAAKPGDIITIGGTSLRVDLVDCTSDAHDADGNLAWEEGATATKECAQVCPDGVGVSFRDCRACGCGTAQAALEPA